MHKAWRARSPRPQTSTPNGRSRGWAGAGLALALALGGLHLRLGAQTLPELTGGAETAAPLASTEAVIYGTASGDDPVGPGDLLDVRIFGQPQLSENLRVGPDGTIVPPFIAGLEAAGKTPQQLQATLAGAYAGMLLHPLVSVRVLEANSRQITVNGEVPRPGVYHFSGRIRLLQALAMAGGVDPVKASPTIYLLHRPPAEASHAPGGESQFTVNEVLETIDVNQIAAHPELDRVLDAGDSIDVPEAHLVYISGDVMHPGSATLMPGLTLTQLISESGGFLPQANTGAVRLLRRVPASTARQTLNLDAGAMMANRIPDLALQPDDIIFVPGQFVRIAGLELLDFFTSTGRWRVEQTMANHVPF